MKETVIRKKITAPAVREMKRARMRIVALTCADFVTSRLLDEAGVDVILVGDSLGTTLLGYESTVSVTMREMLHHLKAVTRARPKALVVADMPFGSYHQSIAQAVRNAVRMAREGGADAVKLEGGFAQAEKIRAIVETGIPVMAHLGLLPQSVLREGGYRVQGRTAAQVRDLRRDLRAVERAGAFACVLEYVRASMARKLTAQTSIPTIGIGSGLHCDGQVLVTSDLLGLQAWLTPKAARKYADLGSIMSGAFKQFARDVREGDFPGKEESFE
ncbi:MAG: 3-methyl-2-oxobutanoate hydroxymethyltransferase [Verrucomicrobia bacterium]|nr:3-methyl-2-oxobutanoate hydroxymethyltransferase [Verrucomicrobiota bacterium]